MKTKILIVVMAALFLMAIAVQLPAQQTIYVAPVNTQQQQLDQLNQSLQNFGATIQRNRQIKAQQEQYEREMQLREQQVETARLEQQHRMEAIRKESERQQAEIYRKRAKKEAYEKAQIYFESESLDIQPKLALLRQKLSSLEANRTTRKEIQ